MLQLFLFAQKKFKKLNDMYTQLINCTVDPLVLYTSNRNTGFCMRSQDLS